MRKPGCRRSRHPNTHETVAPHSSSPIPSLCLRPPHLLWVLENTNFLSLWISLFGTFSINGIIQQVAFWSGFILGMFSGAPVLWQDCASSLLLEVVGVGSKISPKLRRHFETRNPSWPPHTVYSVCSGWRGVEQTTASLNTTEAKDRSVSSILLHPLVCV